MTTKRTVHMRHHRCDRTDYPGLLGAFIGSWVLHCVMFMIAATTTVFYPPTASREIITLDLLFASPGSDGIGSAPQIIQPKQSRQESGDEPEEQTPAKSVAGDELELVTLQAPQPTRMKPAAVRPILPPIRLQSAVAVKKVPPPTQVIIPATDKIQPATKPAEQVTGPSAPTALTVQTKPMEQTEQEKQAVERERLRRQQESEQQAARERAQAETEAAQMAKAAEIERLEAAKTIRARQTAEKARREQAAAEKARQEAEKAAREKLAAERARKEREAAKEKQARERAAEEKAAREKLEAVRLAANAKKSEQPPSGTAGNGGKAGTAAITGSAIIAAAAPQHLVLPATAAAANPEKPPEKVEQKGFALPPVNGDIKLIMTSEEDLIVKVIFVSYPKSRHGKPLTRKESKEQQKLSPVVVRTAKSTLEAVIERSREGVYTFVVEPKGSKTVTSKFAMKLFETKNKSIRNRDISGPTEVARLLMPEGVLWEDESAFTGNIEDSESVTKFNEESGLYWKEYRR